MMNKDLVIKKTNMLLMGMLMQLISYATPGPTYVDENGKTKKLTQATYEMKVEASPQQAWEALAKYGNVAQFHAGVAESAYLPGSEGINMGCERSCTIEQGARKIYIKERIVELRQGKSYTYEVYEWENFPLQKMFVTWGVKTNEKGETIIYNTIDYRLKPGMMSGMMKGKMKSNARNGLLSYRHNIETGQKNVPIKELKKLYKTA